jgi:hypothetical protein
LGVTHIKKGDLNMNINNLKLCFKEAIKMDANYIGVLIQMQGFETPEIIINETPNFKSKLEYYEKAYNEDLTLKTFSGIKIIGVALGDTFAQVEEGLLKS